MQKSCICHFSNLHCWIEMELQDIAHSTCGREEISDISNFNWSNFNSNF